MKLVIDTNRLIAGLLKSLLCREIMLHGANVLCSRVYGHGYRNTARIFAGKRP